MATTSIIEQAPGIGGLGSDTMIEFTWSKMKLDASRTQGDMT